jgi:hypothetical protein
MQAALCAPPEVVRALLAVGADPRPADGNGHTALLYAARTGDRDSVEALLAAGAPVDALAADFLKVLEFPAAAARDEFRQAVAEVAAACRSEPMPVEGLAGVTCFRVPFTREFKELRRAEPDMAHPVAEVLAADRALRAVRDRLAVSLRERGYTLAGTRFSRFTDAVLGLFPTADPFAVVAAVCPYKKDDLWYVTELLTALRDLAATQPFLLTGCGANGIEVEVSTAGESPAALASWGFEVGPAEETPGPAGLKRWRGVYWWDD